MPARWVSSQPSGHGCVLAWHAPFVRKRNTRELLARQAFPPVGALRKNGQESSCKNCTSMYMLIAKLSTYQVN